MCGFCVHTTHRHISSHTQVEIWEYFDAGYLYFLDSGNFYTHPVLSCLYIEDNQDIIFLSLQMSGFGIVAIGIWSLWDKHHYVVLLTTHTYAVTTYLLLGTGGIVILIGFIGCCGAWRENRFCLMTVSIREKKKIKKKTFFLNLKNQCMTTTQDIRDLFV